MATTTMEKTEEDLRKELDALLRQQREITERIRDPRGIRRGGSGGGGGGNGAFACPNSRNLHRGFVRPADWNNSKDEPPPKRRLSYAVVKVDEGEEVAEGEKPILELQNDAPVSRNVTRSSVSIQSRLSSATNGGRQSQNGVDYQAKEVSRVFPKKMILH